jgi:DNA-binding IclR family transcriptional regulator
LSAEDREKGWSYVESEQLDHIASLGAPIKDSRGQVIAAIGPGWYARPEINEERKSKLLPPLLDAAQRAANSIRYKL